MRLTPLSPFYSHVTQMQLYLLLPAFDSGALLPALPHTTLILPIYAYASLPIFLALSSCKPVRLTAAILQAKACQSSSAGPAVAQLAQPVPSHLRLCSHGWWP